MMTEKEKKQKAYRKLKAYRARRISEGYKWMQVWVAEEQVPRVRRYIERANREVGK